MFNVDLMEDKIQPMQDMSNVSLYINNTLYM